MDSCIIKTPLGFAKITGNNHGITALEVLDYHVKVSDIVPETLQKCVTQLQEYFENSRKEFSLKLNAQGTDFQKKVWSYLEKIPYGKTISYIELSKQIVDIKAVRAVANANGKNPLWIIVPCHRVIGANGNLTGYAGGIPRKKWLLDHEASCKQQTLF